MTKKATVPRLRAQPEFREELDARLLDWRREQKSAVSQAAYGRIHLAFPKECWTDNYWPGIRDDVVRRLGQGVYGHEWNHHLTSSWAACANLYLPFVTDDQGLGFLAAFLRNKGGLPELAALTGCEIEYAPSEDDPLHPKPLLGESGGQRGRGQTSPDLALFGKLKDGTQTVVLTESKLAETSFYDCSAFRGKRAKVALRDLSRCDSALDLSKCPSDCWLSENHGRRYWHVLRDKLASEALKSGRPCLAKVGGYQLFRQQALAEGYADSGLYGLVVSAVAYDKRNTKLLKSLATNGIEEFPDGWSRLFSGKARFAAWSHQSWVGWVRKNGNGDRWRSWLDYVGPRYGY